MITANELIERVRPISNQETLLRIAQMASDEQSTGRDVARLVERDQGFAALLFRLANNAAQPTYDLSVDIPRAVARLGLRLVGTMAATAVALRLLDVAPADDARQSRRRLHEHAVNTGVAARLIAPATIDREQALAAGLLHNVGLYGMSVASPSEFRLLLDLVEGGVPFADAEAELYDTSHAEFGAMLATNWSFPAELVDGIRHHAEQLPESPLAATVRVADLMMRESGYGIEPAEPIADELLAVGSASPLERNEHPSAQEIADALTSQAL